MTTCPKCRRSYADGVRFCPVDGTLIAQVVDPYLGRVLMGQFKLVAQAGRGAMGTVYRAEQQNVGRSVAVKILRADLLRDGSAVKRFLREAQAAARLSHPNIVSVHLVGETDEGVPFIVMEFVEGATLGSLCQRLGVVESRRALRIARQIASALGEAHDQGIVHRDLKADNVLLAERPRGRSGGGDIVKVLDFGIAKLLDGDALPGGAIAQLTRDGTIFGTPHYIAPEQASGQDVDGRADLYSLGVILYRMVTGKLPFDGQSGMQVLMRHVREVPPRPREVRPEVAPAVEDLVLTAIAKRREDRFADAESFMVAIDEVDRLLGEEAGRTLLGLSPPGALALTQPRRESPPAAAPLPRRAPTPAPSPVPTVVLPASSVAAQPATRSAEAPEDEVADDEPPVLLSAVRPARATPAAVIVSDEEIAIGRSGDAGLEAWTSRPLPAEEDDELYAAPPRRRALWLGVSAAAVLLLAGGGALWRARGGAASAKVEEPSAAATAAGATAAESAPTDPPLVEEHVASAAGLALRVGFESAPSAGSTAVLRVKLTDAAGRAVTDGRVDASVRRAGERDESVVMAAEGERYRGQVAFRAGGRHAIKLVAVAADGARRVALDFEVDLPGVAGPTPPRPAVARSPVREAPRRGRHVAGLGTPAAGDDEELPVTVIPANSDSDPIVPRALGPAPEAATGGANRGGTPRGAAPRPTKPAHP